MAFLYASHGPCRFERRPRVRERFASLARTIAFQQLAGGAARAVWSRVEEVLDHDVQPPRVLAMEPDVLQAAGLSRAKTAAIIDLAEHIESGRLALERLGWLDDDEVIGQLTQVRGIGVWTAHMFLMFGLRRLDVWPVGDLGVRRGYALAHGSAEIPDAEALQPLGDEFRPYRTLAAWYLWRAADTVTPG